MKYTITENRACGLNIATVSIKTETHTITYEQVFYFDDPLSEDQKNELVNRALKEGVREFNFTPQMA